jgi:hypothetical protein
VPDSDRDLREAIARDILAEKTDCPDHPWPFPKPSCWTCGRNGAFHRAALIATGQFNHPLDRNELARQVLDAYQLKAWQLGLAPRPWWVRARAPLLRAWYRLHPPAVEDGGCRHEWRPDRLYLYGVCRRCETPATTPRPGQDPDRTTDHAEP